MQIPSALGRDDWAPTPITVAPSALTRATGARWLGFKRDDQLAYFGGGTKIRKLDTLLAGPGWLESEGWASPGALGSGHLVAMARAAEHFGVPFEAYTFSQPYTAHAASNLRATLQAGASVRYFGSRVRLATQAPAILGLSRIGSTRVVPPGGSCVDGALGLVVAMRELSAQVAAGALPLPDVIVVPYGSGGTAAGLAVGVALAGLRTRVVGVGVVEAPLSPRRQVRALAARTAARVDAPDPRDHLRIVRGALGRGYGHPTPSGRRAKAITQGLGLPLELTYSAKAFGALLRRPRWARDQHVLYWITPRRPDPGPLAVDTASLPPDVQRWLATDK